MPIKEIKPGLFVENPLSEVKNGAGHLFTEQELRKRAKEHLSTLYHATTMDRKEAILDQGLLPNKPSNWSEIDTTGYIYMGETPQGCVSWIKDMWAHKEIPDVQDIVVFQVNTDGLELEHDIGRNWKAAQGVPPKNVRVYAQILCEKTNNGIRMERI